MNYNQKEIGLIEEATMEASVAVDTAYSLIVLFSEKYLESDDSIRTLVYDAENRYSFLAGQVRAIYTMILEAKKKLDVFSCMDSPELNRSIMDALEVQEILRIKKAG